MANVTFTRSNDATLTSSNTEGLITFNTARHQIELGTGSSVISCGADRLRTITITGGATTGDTHKDDCTITYSQVPGVLIKVVGNKLGGRPYGQWTPGTVTVTPQAGEQGPSYKISCEWSYTSSPSGPGTIRSYSYTVYYLALDLTERS